MISLHPYFSWVGGKTNKIKFYKIEYPSKINKMLYVEPFIGSGAFLFDIKPKKGIISDINTNLILSYKIIKNNVEELIEKLIIHDKKEKKDMEKYYYYIRNKYNKRIGNEIDIVSYLFVLNARCYNGLYRENKSGGYNAPFGGYDRGKLIIKNKIISFDIINNLHNISSYLNNNNIFIINKNYDKLIKFLLEKEKNKMFFLLDPPYFNTFTQYNKENVWNNEKYNELKKIIDLITEQGHYFLLCNENNKYIIETFKNYNFKTYNTNRLVACKNESRKEKVVEVIITNYKNEHLTFF